MFDPRFKTLLSLTETHSFTKTAQLLSLSQPAVSQHIKAIESQFRVKLFDRGNKSLSLTDEGRIIVKYARRMQSLYSGLHRELRDWQKHVKRLTVGVTPTAENNIFSQVLALYCSRNPDLRITIISNSINILYEKLKTYEIDIAIVEGKIVDSHYRSLLLDTDHLMLAVSNENPLSQQQSVTLNQLKTQRLILRLPDSGTRTLFENSLLANNESIDAFDVFLEVDNNSTIKELVEDNFGVSILAKSACYSEIKKHKLRMLPIENLSMVREINMVYHQDFSNPGILQDISDIYFAFVK